MAEKKALRDAFVDELRDTYDAEKQLIKALPTMVRAASHEGLGAAFAKHLDETRGQVQRLERVFRLVDEKARGKHCDGMAGILEEGKSVMEENFDAATMDAALIASAQRVEHYEIAAYGTLVAWARILGLGEAAGVLQQNLDEETAADEKLSALAEGGINQRAGGPDGVASDEASASSLGGFLRRLTGGTTGADSGAAKSGAARRRPSGRPAAKTAKASRNTSAKKSAKGSAKRSTKNSPKRAVKKTVKKTAKKAKKRSASR